jgi:hypothetical protein
MKNFLSKIICFLLKHPCVETGRRGIQLKEVKCLRCNGLFVSHPDYGDTLIPSTESFVEIYERHKNYIK